MYVRKIIARHDKVMNKERELYQSKYFLGLKLSVIVDKHFVKNVDANNITSFTEARDGYDVTLEHRCMLIKLPSRVHSQLAHHDVFWNDGCGCMSKQALSDLLWDLRVLDHEIWTTKTQ